MVDTDKGPSRTTDDYFWTSQESPEGMTTIDKLEHLEEITAAIDGNYLSHHEEIAEMKNHVQFLKAQIMRNNIQQL